MASNSHPPSGPAKITNQGNTLYCTHHSVAKAVANGFWNNKFSLQNRVDFEHDIIMQSLICEYKESILHFCLFNDSFMALSYFFRTPLENGQTPLMEKRFFYQ